MYMLYPINNFRPRNKAYFIRNKKYLCPKKIAKQPYFAVRIVHFDTMTHMLQIKMEKQLKVSEKQVIYCITTPPYFLYI